jgi:hypothetical protein
VDVDGPRHRCGVVAPDFFEEFVAGDDGAAVCDEVAEEFELEGGEVDGGVVALS